MEIPLQSKDVVMVSKWNHSQQSHVSSGGPYGAGSADSTSPEPTVLLDHHTHIKYDSLSATESIQSRVTLKVGWKST